MSDQAVEDEIRELAFMSLRQYPMYAALLRQIDAARKERDAARAEPETFDTSLAGAKIVSVGADGSILLDMPTGGDRKRVWLPGLLAAQHERDEAIEALRPFICEKVRLIHPGNEAHLAVRVGAIHAATEIVQRHDESKKGGDS
jgi:hypothetical protein